MLTFNNNNIFTGYLKQLLASFNLPKYKIYTSAQAEWAAANEGEEKDILDQVIYLKNDTLQYYNSEIKKWTVIADSYHHYINSKDLNNTTTLKIRNNIYDSYTHEYLGNFLRFLNDRYNLDLMPLYNCFSNVACPAINTTIYQNIGGTETEIANFTTANKRYKIYMVPVKFFKSYTIALDCAVPIELFCGFYDVSHIEDNQLASITYRKINQLSFSSPIVYSALVPVKPTTPKAENDQNPKPFLKPTVHEAENEQNLKLFLKIPAENKSSITILEGDYSAYNNIGTTNYEYKYIKDKNDVSASSVVNSETVQNQPTYHLEYMLQSNFEYFSNHLVLNAEALQNKPLDYFNPITNLQLLLFNTGVSHPFSDRLIDYLTGNAITSQETISDNVKRVQQIMQENGLKINIYGLWQDNMRPYLYDYATTSNNKKLFKNINYDILGYVDKSMEKYYIGNKTNTSISNAYIYKDTFMTTQD